MSFQKFYPFSNLTKIIKNQTKEWIDGSPKGITIHYSADTDYSRVYSWLKKEGLNYHLLIDEVGMIIQTGTLDKMVNHAGKANWNKLSPNKYHVSICLMSWGKLTLKDDKYYSWNDQEIPFEDMAIRNNFYWHKATIEQEKMLIAVLDWFVDNGINTENICGHDECALPLGRKTDPGGVLSFSIESIRKKYGEKNHG